MHCIGLLPKLFVRKPVSDDADAIAIFHVRSWQSAYERLLSKHYLSALELSVKQRVVWSRRSNLAHPQFA